MPREESLKLTCFLCLFFVLASSFVLRPLRDEVGIVNGVDNLHWLFTATFIAIIPMLFLFRYFSSKSSLYQIIICFYYSIILLLGLFYIGFIYLSSCAFIASCFFIFMGVSSMYGASLFWILMVDSFSMETSKRIFGFIAAGGSLGALFGSFTSSLMITYFSIQSLIIAAIFFLLMVVFFFQRIIVKVQEEYEDKSKSFGRRMKQLMLGDFQKTQKSKYFLYIIVFTLLYSSISTVLYFQQVFFVESEITIEKNRLLYFSRLDFIINSISILGQFFITKWFLRKYSLSFTLSFLPIILIVGFLVMNIKTSLLIISGLIILHKAGNYILLKPAKEILFTGCTQEEKYGMKNFIDTFIYRGGDAFTGWIFTLLISLGFGLSFIALTMIPVVVYWGVIGKKLGEIQLIKSHIHHEK